MEKAEARTGLLFSLARLVADVRKAWEAKALRDSEALLCVTLLKHIGEEVGRIDEENIEDED